MFRKGDKVVEVLNLGGFTTREPGVVLSVRNGIVYIDQGEGNEPTKYSALTGKYLNDPGARRIEEV